jgi:hypothetical protein
MQNNPMSVVNQMPYWELQEKMREAELENLQRQNAQPTRLTATGMPSTFNDLSFVERMEIQREGWQHAAVGGSSYVQIQKIEDDRTMLGRQQEEAKARAEVAKARLELRKMQGPEGYEEWCLAFPDACLKEKIERDRQTLSLNDFCRKYPNHADCIARDERLRLERLEAERNRDRGGGNNNNNTGGGNNNGGGGDDGVIWFRL